MNSHVSTVFARDDVPYRLLASIALSFLMSVSAFSGTSTFLWSSKIWFSFGDLYTNCIRRFDPKTMISTTVTLPINPKWKSKVWWSRKSGCSWKCRNGYQKRKCNTGKKALPTTFRKKKRTKTRVNAFWNYRKCTIVSDSKTTYNIYEIIAFNLAVRRAPGQSNCDMFVNVLIYLLWAQWFIFLSNVVDGCLRLKHVCMVSDDVH